MNGKTLALILLLGSVAVGLWILDNAPQKIVYQGESGQYDEAKCCVECKKAYIYRKGYLELNFEGKPTEETNCAELTKENARLPCFLCQKEAPLSDECATYFQTHPTTAAGCSKYDCSTMQKKTDTGRCGTYWVGAYYDSEKKECIKTGGSGCMRPFPFSSVEECEQLCWTNQERSGRIHAMLRLRIDGNTDLAQLEKRDILIVHQPYEEGNIYTYYVSMPTTEIAAVSKLPFVERVGEIPLDKKLTPADYQPQGGTENVDINFFRDVPLREGEEIVRTHGGTITSQDWTANEITALVPSEQTIPLAKEDGVSFLYVSGGVVSEMNEKGW